MIRVVIVCEIRLFREGLALLLSRDDAIQPVAAAGTVPDALQAVTELRPDVVLIDGAMPENVRSTRAILASEPTAQIVVVGASEREADVICYAEAGVAGYVTREANASFLCETIHAVSRGETLCTPAIAATLLRRVTILAAQRSTWAPRPRLTVREREIVALIGLGLSNKEIAGRLYIEAATVKNHVHRILGKLEVHRRGDIAAAMHDASHV